MQCFSRRHAYHHAVACLTSIERLIQMSSEACGVSTNAVPCIVAAVRTSAACLWDCEDCACEQSASAYAYSQPCSYSCASVSLQYVREHGEACPATWKPGQKGISEDLKKIFTEGLSK